MKKKVIMTGSPAYMGQYASLMILLLAFFIVLVSMSAFQEGGFKAGVGEIRNAFGISGGFGIFDYSIHGKGFGNPPNMTVDERGQEGVDVNLLTGVGGVGETDMNTETAKNSKYVRFKLGSGFPERSDALTPELREELKRLGLGLSLFNYAVQIRSYSSEYPDAGKNKNLALSRAAQIMRYLELSTGVPYDKMSCAGYSDKKYFDSETGTLNKEGQVSATEVRKRAENEESDLKQGTYFYILVKNAPEKK